MERQGGGHSSEWPKNIRVTVPLCKNKPGNVGLAGLDAQGRRDASVEQSILHPDNPPIALPSWQYVTSTGNVNSKKIDDALNTYDNRSSCSRCST